MEYVIVKYTESRKVLVDGETTGLTNELLRLEEGAHTFELSGARDYRPLAQTLIIQGTSLVKPNEVTFEKAETKHCGLEGDPCTDPYGDPITDPPDKKI